jgi:hypothetical protein
MTTRRPLLIAAALLGTAAVAGTAVASCSSSGSHHAARARPSAAPSSSGAPAAPPPLGSLHGVIITMRCGTAGPSDDGPPDPRQITLTPWDPGTGAAVPPPRTLTLPAWASPGVTCHERAAGTVRAAFNGDLSRLAVVIATADDSADPGYADVATGRIVDALSASPPSTSPSDPTGQFGLATSLSDGAYGPDGRIYTRGGGDPRSAGVSAISDAGGGTLAPAGASRGPFAVSDAGVTPGEAGRVPVAGPGGLAAREESSPDGISIWQGSSYIRTLTIEQGMPPEAAEPLAWSGPHTIIASSGNAAVGTGLELLTLTPGLDRVVSVDVLAPLSDRAQVTPVVSPDGRQIAWLSRRGSVADVERIDLGPDGRPTDSPRPIGTASAQTLLLAWQ